MESTELGFFGGNRPRYKTHAKILPIEIGNEMLKHVYLNPIQKNIQWLVIYKIIRLEI